MDHVFQQAENLMNPEKEENISYLYYSASSAVNSKDYDTALEYYLKLKNITFLND